MTKQTVLVTGVNGFVGEHLVRELANNGHDIIGSGIQEQPLPSIKNLLKEYFCVDLTKSSEVDSVEWGEIDSVIHLAGLSDVGASFTKPSLYMHINTAVLCELFESAKRTNTTPRFIVVSTGAVYQPSDKCVAEGDPTYATSPYSASKLASELVVEYYRGQGFGDATIARPFNHIGPGQGPGFIVPDLAAQVINSEDGDEVEVGNLLTSRDYTDVRDVVRAYRMLAEANELDHGLYNICSSRSIEGVKIFEQLARAANKNKLTFRSSVKKLRPSDVAFVCGSNERIKHDIDWSPQISFEHTIEDVVSSLT